MLLWQYEPSRLEAEWLQLVRGKTKVGELTHADFCQRRATLSEKLGRSANFEANDMRPSCATRVSGPLSAACKSYRNPVTVDERPVDGSCLRCSGAVVCIEPLVELLRSPLVPCLSTVHQHPWRGQPSWTYNARHMDSREVTRPSRSGTH